MSARPPKLTYALLLVPLVSLFAYNTKTSKTQAPQASIAADLTIIQADKSTPIPSESPSIHETEAKIETETPTSNASTSNALLETSTTYSDEKARMTKQANLKDILSDDPVALCKSMREEMVNRSALQKITVSEWQLDNLVCTYGVMAKSTPDTAQTRWGALTSYGPKNTYIDNQLRWAAFIYFDPITNKEIIQLWIKTKGHGFANPDGEYGPNFSAEPHLGLGKHSYVRRDYLPGYDAPAPTEPVGHQTLRINWGFGQAVYHPTPLLSLRHGAIHCDYASLCPPLNLIKLVTTENGDNAFFPISQSNAVTQQNTVSGFMVSLDLKLTEKGPMFGLSGNYVNERGITSNGSIRKISHTKPTNDIRIGQLDYLVNHEILKNQEYGKIKHSAASLPIQPNLSVRYQIDPSLRGKSYPFNFLASYAILKGRPSSEAEEAKYTHFQVVPKRDVYNMTTGFIVLPGGTSVTAAQPMCKIWSYSFVGQPNTFYANPKNNETEVEVYQLKTANYGYFPLQYMETGSWKPLGKSFAGNKLPNCYYSDT